MSRLRLRRGGWELELEGDEAFIARYLERFLPLLDPPATERDLPRVAPEFQVRKNLDFEDFVAIKGPSRDLERLLVLAYYQEKYEGHGAYDLPELGRAWEEAWPALPWDEALGQQAVEEGYLQREAGERLTLSFRGYQFVQEGLA